MKNSLSWYILIVYSQYIISVIYGEKQPYIRLLEQPNSTFIVNHEAILRCSAESSSKLRFQWLRNGTVLSQRNCKIETTLLESTLVAGSEHCGMGTYKCCVTNKLGIICSVPVDITLPIIVKPNLNYHIRGKTARLECLVGESLPKPTLKWLKDGEQLDVANGSIHLIGSGIIHIEDFELRDGLNFQCAAYNIAGDRTSDPRNIHQPMQIRQDLLTSGQDDVRAVIGSSVFLESFFRSEENGRWVKDGAPFNTISGRKIHNSYVKLSRIQASDRGIYKYTDIGGRVLLVYKLSILEKPVVVGGPEDCINEQTLTTINIPCKMTAEPRPTITWYKNGERIRPSHRICQHWDHLQIQMPNLGDSGVYQCVGRNEVGSASQSSLLTFKKGKDPPPEPRNLISTDVTMDKVCLGWTVPRKFEHTLNMVFYYPDIDSDDNQYTCERPQNTLVNSNLNQTCIQGLNPNTRYVFFMAAFDKLASYPTPEITARTLETVPSRGPLLSVWMEGFETINLTWTAISDTFSNGAVKQYEVCCCQTVQKDANTCQKVDADSRAYRITELHPGIEYGINVYVINNVGKGPSSAPLSITVPDSSKTCTVPPLISFLTFAVDNRLEVSWAEPIRTDVQGYLSLSNERRVEKLIQLQTDSTYYVLSDLSPNVIYTVCIYAENACGRGFEMKQQINILSKEAANPKMICPTPVYVRVKLINSTVVRVQWDKPLLPFNHKVFVSCPKQDIHYIIRVPRNKSKATISHLPYFAKCIVVIQSYHGNHTSTGSSGVMFETDTGRPETPPSKFGISNVSTDAVGLEWEPPSKPNGIIMAYVVEYGVQEINESELLAPKGEESLNLRTTLGNLRSDTLYMFRMSAMTSAGQGPSTDLVSQRTLSSSASPKDKGTIETILLSTSALPFILAISIVICCGLQLLLLVVKLYVKKTPKNSNATRPQTASLSGTSLSMTPESSLTHELKAIVGSRLANPRTADNANDDHWGRYLERFLQTDDAISLTKGEGSNHGTSRHQTAGAADSLEMVRMLGYRSKENEGDIRQGYTVFSQSDDESTNNNTIYRILCKLEMDGEITTDLTNQKLESIEPWNTSGQTTEDQTLDERLKLQYLELGCNGTEIPHIINGSSSNRNFESCSYTLHVTAKNSLGRSVEQLCSGRQIVGSTPHTEEQDSKRAQTESVSDSEQNFSEFLSANYQPDKNISKENNVSGLISNVSHSEIQLETTV